MTRIALVDVTAIRETKIAMRGCINKSNYFWSTNFTKLKSDYFPFPKAFRTQNALTSKLERTLTEYLQWFWKGSRKKRLRLRKIIRSLWKGFYFMKKYLDAAKRAAKDGCNFRCGFWAELRSFHDERCCPFLGALSQVNLSRGKSRLCRKLTYPKVLGFKAGYFPMRRAYLIKVLKEAIEVIHFPYGLVHGFHHVRRVLLQFHTVRLLLLRLQLLELFEQVQ